MTPTSWAEVDGRVLAAIADLEEEHFPDDKALIAKTGIQSRPMMLALTRLCDEQLITGHPVKVDQSDIPVRFVEIRTTGEGRRHLGLWPPASEIGQALLDELLAVAESTEDPEKAPRLQAVAREAAQWFGSNAIGLAMNAVGHRYGLT